MSGDAVARDSPNITFVETNEILEQDRIFVIDNLLLYSSQIPAARPCELIVSRIAAGNGCRNRFVLLFEFGPLRIELCDLFRLILLCKQRNFLVLFGSQ